MPPPACRTRSSRNSLRVRARRQERALCTRPRRARPAVYQPLLAIYRGLTDVRRPTPDALCLSPLDTDADGAGPRRRRIRWTVSSALALAVHAALMRFPRRTARDTHATCHALVVTRCPPAARHWLPVVPSSDAQDSLPTCHTYTDPHPLAATRTRVPSFCARPALDSRRGPRAVSRSPFPLLAAHTAPAIASHSPSVTCRSPPVTCRSPPLGAHAPCSPLHAPPAAFTLPLARSLHAAVRAPVAPVVRIPPFVARLPCLPVSCCPPPPPPAARIRTTPPTARFPPLPLPASGFPLPIAAARRRPPPAGCMSSLAVFRWLAASRRKLALPAAGRSPASIRFSSTLDGLAVAEAGQGDEEPAHPPRGAVRHPSPSMPRSTAADLARDSRPPPAARRSPPAAVADVAPPAAMRASCRALLMCATSPLAGRQPLTGRCSLVAGRPAFPTWREPYPSPRVLHTTHRLPPHGAQAVNSARSPDARAGLTEHSRAVRELDFRRLPLRTALPYRG
ncbi:hypothetical protein GGX14DRAFT_563387 [Mycena pura]|uniref:Uncharacterized protein n=1 Tax=Mycena pura TaxID=153505 RepID=A0AAD6YD47_9AGAR|nr:hypothetical protein GGX14DRAFT_563387 [Mycena pura]